MISILAAALASAAAPPQSGPDNGPPPVVARPPLPRAVPPAPTARVPAPPLPTPAPTTAPMTAAIPEPSAEAIAEALKMFSRAEFRNNMMAGMLSSMQARMRALEGSPTGAQAAAFFDRLHDAMLPEFERIIDLEIDNIRSRVARLYAQHFSLEELRELNLLFRNPLYQRLTQLSPGLILQSNEIMITVLTPYRQRFEQLGMNIARQLLEEQEQQRRQRDRRQPRS